MPPQTRKYDVVRVFFNVNNVHEIARGLRANFPNDLILGLTTIHHGRVTSADLAKLLKVLEEQTNLPRNGKAPIVNLLLGPILDDVNNKIILERLILKHGLRYEFKITPSVITEINKRSMALPAPPSQSLFFSAQNSLSSVNNYSPLSNAYESVTNYASKVDPVEPVIAFMFMYSIYRMYKLFRGQPATAQSNTSKKNKAKNSVF